MAILSDVAVVAAPSVSYRDLQEEMIEMYFANTQSAFSFPQCWQNGSSE